MRLAIFAPSVFCAEEQGEHRRFEARGPSAGTTYLRRTPNQITVCAENNNG
jgi:hypothetical protein